MNVAIGDAALKRKVQVLSPSRVAVTVVGNLVSFPSITIVSKGRRSELAVDMLYAFAEKLYISQYDLPLLPENYYQFAL